MIIRDTPFIKANMKICPKPKNYTRHTFLCRCKTHIYLSDDTFDVIDPSYDEIVSVEYKVKPAKEKSIYTQHLWKFEKIIKLPKHIEKLSYDNYVVYVDLFYRDGREMPFISKIIVNAKNYKAIRIKNERKLKLKKINIKRENNGKM